MQHGDLFVQMLGQGIDLFVIGLGIGPKFNLGQSLVGEGGAHHKARMARGIAKIDQAALGQDDQLLAVREFHMVDLGLDFVPAEIAQGRNLNFGIEVADIADNGVILHRPHVIERNHILIARGGDEDVSCWGGSFERANLIAFHRSLQGADGINFRNDHARAALAQRSRRPFADIAVTADHGHLARQHHVCAAPDRIDQAFAATIEVVELRLSDAVIDIDGREGKLALFRHLIKPVDARGGLFRDARNGGADGGIEAGLFLQIALHDGVERFLFLIGRVVEHARVLFRLGAKHAKQRGVATVIEDQVGIAAVGPLKNLVRIVPIFEQVLALEGKDRRSGRGDGGGGVVLRREDVAGRPTHLRAERLQGFDQHGRLDGHVQRARNARAFQYLTRTIFGAGGHQARHFGFGDLDFFAAPGGEAEVFDDIVGHGAGSDQVCFPGHRARPFQKQ